jgi:hypothetical protein
LADSVQRAQSIRVVARRTPIRARRDGVIGLAALVAVGVPVDEQRFIDAQTHAANDSRVSS